MTNRDTHTNSKKQNINNEWNLFRQFSTDDGFINLDKTKRRFSLFVPRQDDKIIIFIQIMHGIGPMLYFNDFSGETKNILFPE